VLAERARFRLEYFACESRLFDTLLRFLSAQRHLLEITYLSRSPDTQTTTWVRGQEALHTVHTLSRMAPLLLHSQLDGSSLRRLEYIGGGQSLRGEDLPPRTAIEVTEVRVGRWEDVPGRDQVFLHRDEYLLDQAHTYRTSAET